MQKRSQQWAQAEYARAHSHLSGMGVLNGKITQSESRVLPPLVALWRCSGKLDGKELELWVITGQEIPTDHLAVNVAKDARDAMRHFSMSWHLKAARLEQEAKDQASASSESGELRQNYIKSLTASAERLAQLVETPALWPEFQKA